MQRNIVKLPRIMRIAQIGAVYIFEKRHIPARSSARHLREAARGSFYICHVIIKGYFEIILVGTVPFLWELCYNIQNITR